MRVTCPGRLDYSKGQDVLLRALPGLARRFPGLEIRFLGQGPQRAKLLRLAAQLGVAAVCQFPGEVPHEQVLRELSQSAVATVPSRHESLGLVNIEALSVSTPVVASNVGGIPEIIRDGLDGLLVPPEDPAALEACLGRLLANAQLRAEMGRNGRARFLSAFEAQGRVSQYADWIEAELDRCARA